MSADYEFIPNQEELPVQNKIIKETEVVNIEKIATYSYQDLIREMERIDNDLLRLNEEKVSLQAKMDAVNSVLNIIE